MKKASGSVPCASKSSCIGRSNLISSDFSKPALLEGLEVDQYMWSVIQNQQCADADEVQIDNQANMKPLFIKVRFAEMSFGAFRTSVDASAANASPQIFRITIFDTISFFQSEGGTSESNDSKQIKPISPSSIKLPSMGAWDLPNSKSPALYAPPDMNSKISYIVE